MKYFCHIISSQLPRGYRVIHENWTSFAEKQSSHIDISTLGLPLSLYKHSQFIGCNQRTVSKVRDSKYRVFPIVGFFIELKLITCSWRSYLMFTKIFHWKEILSYYGSGPITSCRWLNIYTQFLQRFLRNLSGLIS